MEVCYSRYRKLIQSVFPYRSVVYEPLSYILEPLRIFKIYRC